MKLVETSDYVIFFDNVRVDPYVINWKTNLGLFADGAVGSVTLLKTHALDKLKLHLTQVRIFGKNIFTGKFGMVFEGEITDRSWNENRQTMGMITYNVKGFYHWLDIGVPLNLTQDDVYVNAKRFEYEAQNINSAEAYEMLQMQKDALLKNKTIEEVVKFLFERIHKTYYDIGKTDTTFSFTGLEDRFKILADIDKVFRESGYLDAVTFSRATKLETFYSYLNDLLSQLSFEFYQDRDGTFKIKPPAWKDDILTTHILDESIVQNSSYHDNWEAEPSRVLVKGGTNEMMIGELRNSITPGSQLTATVPMGLYIGTPEKGNYISQMIEAKIYGKAPKNGSSSGEGSNVEGGAYSGDEWVPPAGGSFMMKYKIKTQYLTAPSQRRSGDKLNQVKFIVAHDVGGPNSTAQANVSYYERSRNEMSASAHLFVDDKEIIECIPAITGPPEKAWHVQNAKPKDNELYGIDANDGAIGVEFCYFTNGKGDSNEAYKRYVWVLAYLCYHFKLNPSKAITSHEILDPQRRVDPSDALKRIGRNYQQLLRDIVTEYYACLGQAGKAGPDTKVTQEKNSSKPLTSQIDPESRSAKPAQFSMVQSAPRMLAAPRALTAKAPPQMTPSQGGSIKAALDSGGWAENILATSYYAADDPMQGGFSTAVGYSIRGTITYKGYRIVAVDPKYVPLYSIVEIEQVGDVHSAVPAKFLAAALDTGGAIKVNHIDILTENRSVAYSWGKRQVRMRIVQRGGGVKSKGKDIVPIGDYTTGTSPGAGAAVGDSPGGTSSMDGNELVQTYPTELPEFKSNYEPMLSEDEKKYKMNLKSVDQVLIRNDLKSVTEGKISVDELMKRYAKYIMHLSRANAHTINVNLSTMMPLIRPGFNAWLEPTRENIVFYITGVSHTGDFQRGCSTSLTGGYLRSPENYDDIENSVFIGTSRVSAKDFGNVVNKTNMNNVKEKLKKMHDADDSIIAHNSQELRELYTIEQNTNEKFSTKWNKEYTINEIQNEINQHFNSAPSLVKQRAKDLDNALEESVADYAKFLLMQRT